VSSLPQWGPQQHKPPDAAVRRALNITALIAFVVLLAAPSWISTTFMILVGVLQVVRVGRWAQRRLKQAKPSPGAKLAATPDPLRGALDYTARLGGGVYLGTTPQGAWVCARAQHAVLLLGPPRSGKTSGVITPGVLSHNGAVVCASTKPDVLAASVKARGRLGRVWEFDPTGERAALGADSQLRWSPVASAWSWDGALLMARSMVTGSRVGAGTTDSTHWSKRAGALLAPMLHAASLSGQDIGTVAGWVLRHDLQTPTVILERARALLPAGVLAGLQNTEARERSSIFSAAADALDAYSATGALTAAQNPNFDAPQFVRSNETIYIHAPAEHQALAAPLVCGLLSEIRAATYAAHRDGQLPRPVLFALDEAANIAPLGDLPQLASEGGGQGLQLLACFQDLSQARQRWGQAAEGFLTLFGTKLILPGIADRGTLETVSIALGEYDRQIVSSTRTRPHVGLLTPTHGSYPVGQVGTTTTIQRQRVLTPGEIANIPAGRGLHLDGVNWQLVTLTPAYRTEPWATITTAANRR
jgi:type IV secretion system protein VirD4